MHLIRTLRKIYTAGSSSSEQQAVEYDMSTYVVRVVLVFIV